MNIKCPQCGTPNEGTPARCGWCRAGLPLTAAGQPPRQWGAPGGGAASANNSFGAAWRPAPYADYRDFRHRRIGGWLIVFAVVLFITGAFSALQLFGTMRLIGDDGWARLHAPDAPAFAGDLALFISFEFFGSAFVVLCVVFLLVCFFAKVSYFPKLATALILAILAVSLFHFSFFQILADMLPSEAARKLNSSAELTVGRGILNSLIWISYLHKSARVKATFVN